MTGAKRKIIRILTLTALLIVLLTMQIILRRTLTRSNLKNDRVSLHSIAISLESYYIDWSEYPDKLERLVEVRDLIARDGKVVEMQPYLYQLPLSSFGQKEPPHYFRSQLGWFLWTPGPDQDFDITITPEFHEVFNQYFTSKSGMNQEFSSPWLRERIYDPTNGTYSNGDIFWAWNQQ